MLYLDDLNCTAEAEFAYLVGAAAGRTAGNINLRQSITGGDCVAISSKQLVSRLWESPMPIWQTVEPMQATLLVKAL